MSCATYIPSCATVYGSSMPQMIDVCGDWLRLGDSLTRRPRH